MKQLAEGVYFPRGFPPNAINVFVIGDVLLDAATKHSGRRILRQLKGHEISAHALTHAHSDHQGASKQVCETLGIPLWCGAGDKHAMETHRGTRDAQPDHWLNEVMYRMYAGPPHPVDRTLAEGDEIAGFTVLEVPGHSDGHLAFWRESDGVLVAGDVFNNMNLITSVPGLHEPPIKFTPDPPRNRESIRRLAALRPRLALVGHGPPLRNPDKLARFADALPD